MLAGPEARGTGHGKSVARAVDLVGSICDLTLSPLPGEDQPTQQQGEGQQGQQAEQRSDAKPAADSAPVQVAVRPAASPSFTEQLRNAGRRVPVPAGMAVRPAGSVPVSSSVS